MAEVVTESKPFNAVEYMKQANEREAASRNPALPKVPQPEVRTEAPKSEEPKPGLNRAARRALNQANQALGEERGRRLQLEEQIKAGSAPAAPKPVETPKDQEPQRAAFADDAAYYKALAKYYGEKGGEKAAATIEDKAEKERLNQAVAAQYEAAGKKVPSDIAERFDDWSDVANAAVVAAEERAEEAEDGKDPWALDPQKDPTFNQMLHLSRQKASLLYHFAKNPEALGELLELKDGSADQILAFKELEGEVKVLYAKKQKKEEPQETAAERDLKKHRPSSVGAPRGGTAPVTTISPYLADGKTLNPAWKSQRNEAQQGR